MEVLSIAPLFFNLLRINKNIEAKSKLLLNPLFPTLKKEIIHLFIVSLPKVPEFWCFFSNTKLLIFGNFYFIIEKSLNSFILWKALSNKEEPFVLQQASQIFPNMVLEVEVKRITIGEEGATKTYKLVGKLNKEKLSNEELINLYDKHYKPLLGYSFTEFEFTYSILYTVEAKSNIPIDASVVILEKVKNNFELTTQYKIESVEV